jgi:prepilin signal peptidase PulO-like enzyme (type II secretory pathway)
MLSTLPNFAVITLLAILGTAIGAFINYAIYAWTITMHRPISPWLKFDESLMTEMYQRFSQGDPTYHYVEVTNKNRALYNDNSWMDRIPIFGWFRLRRKSELYGSTFWIRPMLIELAWLIGLPWFYFWQLNGGLTGDTTVFPGGNSFGAPGALTAAQWAGHAETWFWCHSILLALMFIATFIDFDEKMIPDQITVPGTLLALLATALFPWSQLPFISANITGTSLEHVHYASQPNSMGAWHAQWPGLLTSIAIFSVWIWGLLPKFFPPRRLRLGFFGSLKIAFAFVLRPRRKTECAIRIEQRSMFPITKVCALIFLIGVPLLVLAWFTLPTQNWSSLFTSMIGMAVGGGLIWAIRIAGSWAMGQEAMGFGDVTLMFMIGAMLGWQASIGCFFYGIFIAMFFAIALLLITGKNYLAFGPYLCMGAAVTIFRWPSVWAGGQMGFFRAGPWLLLILLVSLGAMLVLLPLVRWIKILLLGDEELEEEG